MTRFFAPAFGYAWELHVERKSVLGIRTKARPFPAEHSIEWSQSHPATGLQHFMITGKVQGACGGARVARQRSE